MRLLITLFSLLMVTAFYSCRKDMPSSIQTEDVLLRFSLNIPEILPKSSSTKTSNAEDVITNVYLFFFSADDNKVHSVIRNDKIGVEGLSRSFEVELKVGKPGLFYAHALSNIDGFMANKDYANIYNGLSYLNLQKELQAAFTTVNKGLVMWGKSDEFSSKTQNHSLNFSLLRSVARLDIGVGQYIFDGNWSGETSTGARIPFVLNSVRIYNANDAIAFMPLETSYSDNPTNITVNVPSVAGRASSEPYNYSISNNSIQRVYLPEADVIQAGVSGDHNHINRCAIVVGGYYNGSQEESFYRVDFKEDGSSNQLLNILRNHLYRLDISSVTGTGYLNSQKAYESQSINMEVNIEAWAELSQNIIFDGQTYIQIQSRDIILSGAAGIERLVKIVSNIDPATWMMSFTSSPNTSYQSSGVTGIQSDDFIFSRPIIVDKVNGIYEWFFTVKAKNELKKGSVDKVEIVRINASSLTFDVTITQRSISSEDWGDGGNNNIAM